MAAVGSYSAAAKQAYSTPSNAYYTMQSPQAAAAALTAAMMQAVQQQPQVSQALAGNQNYFQPSYTAPAPMPQASPQQTPFSQASFPIQQMSTPQWVVPQFQATSEPPKKLTEGMPDPAAVDRQKGGYLKTLEEQRQHYIKALDGQRKEHLDSIYGQAEQAKKQFLLQLDQSIKDQTVALEKQYGEQVMQLNQQFHSQRGLLETEAIKLKGDYQQKHLEEQAMQRQFQLQKERCEMEQKYAADMQLLQQQQFQMSQHVAQLPPMAPFPASQASSGTVTPYYDGAATPGTGVGSYVPPVTIQGAGSYVPPVTMHVPQTNYEQGPYQQSTGSYVPPVTMQAQSGSYVPPAAASAGSYVPPVTTMGTQGGSWVPPPSMGSYTAPTVVSYVPPEPNMQMHQSASYAASNVSTELAGSYELSGSYVPPVVITQPQIPVYHKGQSRGEMLSPEKQNSNSQANYTSFVQSNYLSAPTVPTMTYN